MYKIKKPEKPSDSPTKNDFQTELYSKYNIVGFEIEIVKKEIALVKIIFINRDYYKLKYDIHTEFIKFEKQITPNGILQNIVLMNGQPNTEELVYFNFMEYKIKDFLNKFPNYIKYHRSAFKQFRANSQIKF